MALSTKELQKRIEYLKALDRNMQKISNKNILQAKKLVSIVVGDSIDLTSSSEIGGLLSSLDEEIELELREDMYNTVVDSIREVAQMGTMHTVVASSSILKDKAFDFLGLADRLALDYINRVEKDGKKLSDRIWSEDDKQAIYNEVYNGIRNGLNSYEVAKNIEEQVTKGIPKYSIERVANTEMHYAYSRAKIDTAVAEAEEFPELENYIEVKLSPAHPKPDICFRKGTQVLTENGYMAIENINIGDYVITHKGRKMRVNNTSRSLTKDIIQLENSHNQTVYVTPNHPFLTLSGWKKVCDLEEGEEICSWCELPRSINNVLSYIHSMMQSTECKVKGIKVLSTSEYVYNLNVDIDNSYIVHGMVVHNCDVMQGTYKASEAPIPPFHPGCLCITRNIVRPSSKKIDTTNVRKQLKEFKDSELLNVGKIETSKKTYTIPKTESTK